jgi:hypothetical protein
VKFPTAFVLIGLLVVLCADAGAQMHHDPLNPREVDLLRDSAQQPKKRIDLLISFARERMLAVDRLCAAKNGANPPGLDDASRVADLLADLAALIDELDDNLAMYSRHSEDLRRPLRHVLDAEAEFLPKLEALNERATPLQKRRLAAALEDALDSVKTSSESARAMLAGQIEKKGEEKDKEKPDRREARQTDTHESDAERQ